MNFIDTLGKRKIILEGEEYTLLPLGDFFRLYNLKFDLSDAIKQRNKDNFRKTILEIWDIQTHKPPPSKLFKLLIAVIRILDENKISAEAAFLKTPPKTDKEETTKNYFWEYPGRTLATWIDAFAEKYNWSLEQILGLPVDTAVYLYQEIKVSEQLQKEWQYSLTELAYPYNKNTERNEFKPLVRPYWMQEDIAHSLPITKIPKSRLPMGIVVNVSGMELMAQNEQPPEKIVS